MEIVEVVILYVNFVFQRGLMNAIGKKILMQENIETLFLLIKDLKSGGKYKVLELSDVYIKKHINNKIKQEYGSYVHYKDIPEELIEYTKETYSFI